MFLPGEKAMALWDEVEVVSVEGHTVTVRAVGGYLYTYPEDELTRPRVEPPVMRFRLGADTRESLPFGDAMKFWEFLVGLLLDWRGHHRNGSDWSAEGWSESEPDRRNTLFLPVGSGGRLQITPETVHAVTNGTFTDRWYPVVRGRRGYTCAHCPVGTVFETNGLVIRPTEPCPHPDGLVTEFTLNVPSGKIIIDDDLRYLCRIAGDRDVNTRWGTHLSILDYARNGLALGFGIGNSSPTIARQEDGKYTIGHMQGGEDVAEICTDLWAYSIIDYEEAERRALYYGTDLAEATKNWSVSVVEIPAGRYLFRHFHAYDRDAEKVLNATFERVGDAVEPVDWCAEDAAFTVHISQAVQYMVKTWPSLYGKDVEQAWAGVLRAEFDGCVPSRDWHRNGHRNHYLREDAEGLPILEIPHFRFQGGWDVDRSMIETTVTGKDALFGGDCPFNESYAVAAGRVLESILSFGSPPRHITETGPEFDTFAVKEARQGMRKAASLWYGLVERYPHVAVESPVFAAWMEDQAAVSKWITKFDLGPEKFDREAFDREQAEKLARERRTRDEALMRTPGTQVKTVQAGRLGKTVDDPNCPDGRVCVVWENGDRSDVRFEFLELGPEAASQRDSDVLARAEEYLKHLREMMADLD